MKAHVGVDSKTKIIHTAVATAANVADSTVLAGTRRSVRAG
jgi:IS5 family transposase